MQGGFNHMSVDPAQKRLFAARDVILWLCRLEAFESVWND
jgi:hypothetical protein